MWNLIYKDIMLSKKALIIMLIFAIGFPLTVGSKASQFNSSMGSLIIVGFSFFITAIEIEERDKSYRIIHSLPVARKESVIARYVGSLIISTLSIVAVSILFLILSSFMGDIYNLIDYRAMINSMSVIVTISSIVMVITYSFGQVAAKIANFIAIFSIFPIYTGIFLDSGNELLINATTFANNSTASMLIIKSIIAMLVYLLSIVLSISIYEHRDL